MEKLKIINAAFIADTLAVEKGIAGDAAEVIALSATSEQEMEGSRFCILLLPNATTGSYICLHRN